MLRLSVGGESPASPGCNAGRRSVGGRGSVRGRIHEARGHHDAGAGRRLEPPRTVLDDLAGATSDAQAAGERLVHASVDGAHVEVERRIMGRDDDRTSRSRDRIDVATLIDLRLELAVARLGLH